MARYSRIGCTIGSVRDGGSALIRDCIGCVFLPVNVHVAVHRRGATQLGSMHRASKPVFVVGISETSDTTSIFTVVFFLWSSSPSPMHRTSQCSGVRLIHFHGLGKDKRGRIHIARRRRRKVVATCRNIPKDTLFSLGISIYSRPREECCSTRSS